MVVANYEIVFLVKDLLVSSLKLAPFNQLSYFVYTDSMLI